MSTTPTKHYAALLYRLADEIQAAGTTAIDPEQIREAAQRMDEQTVEINQLRRPGTVCPRCTKSISGEGIHTCTPTEAWRAIVRERDDLLAALEALDREGF